MRRTLLFICSILCALCMMAQNIVVQSFRLDETDLTANTAGTIVMDQNGQKCALIKIETTQTGFWFDTGLLMPQKVEQHPGEVWVYLPEGMKRITIGHPQLGVLRDHDLGLTVKRAKTYIMKLTTGEVQTVVKQARTSQFVVFQLTPPNAIVRLDGSLLSTTDGTAMKYMPFGTYDYMVEAPDYQSEAGKVTVNDPKNKHVVNVRLKTQQTILVQTKEKPKSQPQPQSSPKVEIDVVDTGIPTTNRVNKNSFAIIIANENYRRETKVEYAKNDGEVFKKYCHKTLGLPEKNVHFIPDATLNDLIGEIYWLQQVCTAFKGEASVIFYYAGHGLPDESSGSVYLLPTDGNSRLLRTCFSINELYDTLGKLPAKKVTVVMDACFSGAMRNGDMLASTRGVVIKAKSGVPQGKMIVFSAAQGDETAYKYEDARHGLFTYFLLKKLKESKGDVTLGELSRYIQDQVGRYSIVENGKSQTPTVQTSDAFRSSWENFKFN